jgi:hypothetical protein
MPKYCANAAKILTHRRNIRGRDGRDDYVVGNPALRRYGFPSLPQDFRLIMGRDYKSHYHISPTLLNELII